MQAFLDEWQDDTCNHKEMIVSEDNEIPMLIDVLDGQHHTLISFLQSGDDNVLQVAGGPEHFVVTGRESEKTYNLTKVDIESEDRVAIVAGGNEGLFEPKYAVTKQDVVNVALAYFHSATIPADDPRFTWEILDDNDGDTAEVEDETTETEN